VISTPPPAEAADPPHDDGADASSRASAGENTTSSWRNDGPQRARVVHWLIACVISGFYGGAYLLNNDSEQADSDSEDEGYMQREAEQPTKKAESQADGTAAASLKSTSNERTSLVELADPKRFALGFTTGDDRADPFLTVLRMKLLGDLEAEHEKDRSRRFRAPASARRAAAAVAAKQLKGRKEGIVLRRAGQSLVRVV